MRDNASINGTIPSQELDGAAHICTEFLHLPIPTRSHDWQAWRAGDEDDGPYGYGETEAEAVLNLIRNIAEGAA